MSCCCCISGQKWIVWSHLWCITSYPISFIYFSFPPCPTINPLRYPPTSPLPQILIDKYSSLIGCRRKIQETKYYFIFISFLLFFCCCTTLLESYAQWKPIVILLEINWFSGPHQLAARRGTLFSVRMCGNAAC